MDLSQLAAHIGAELFTPQSGIPLPQIRDIAPIETAEAGQITFLTNPAFAAALKTTKASAVIVGRPLPDCSLPQLVHPNPYGAMALAAQAFTVTSHPWQGQSSLAYVAPSASVDPTAILFPFAYVAPNAIVGAGCVLYPHTFVGPDCKLGVNCVLHPGAVLYERTELGDGVLVHGAAVLGSDGFGFAPTAHGIAKIPQRGNVRIGHHVEVGAGSTIDRATFATTQIGEGCKLDSQVHVAHNCDVGPHSMLCGQSGIAGSTKVGPGFVAGGQAGVANNLTVGAGVRLGAKTSLLQSTDDKGDYMGTPARPAMEWKRQMAALDRLPELLKRVRALEEKLEQLPR